MHQKASVSTHSLARNHALVDGNKHLELAGLIAFLGVNDHGPTSSNNEAYEFIMALSRGKLDDMLTMAGILSNATELR